MRPRRQQAHGHADLHASQGAHAARCARATVCVVMSPQPGAAADSSCCGGRNTIRRRKRVRHRIEPRHGDPRRLPDRIGHEADEHAARRRSLDGRNRRAAEASLERAICRRAVVYEDVVVAGLGRERVEAQVDRRARGDGVIAGDAAGIVGGDGDGSVRCGESSRRVRATACSTNKRALHGAVEHLPVQLKSTPHAERMYKRSVEPWMHATTRPICTLAHIDVCACSCVSTCICSQS
jgi:hypothetical protein